LLVETEQQYELSNSVSPKHRNRHTGKPVF